MDKYVDIGNNIYKVKKYNKDKKCKLGYAYIKGQCVYPYRGEYKKGKNKVGIYSDGKEFKIIKAVGRKKLSKYHISNIYKLDMDNIQNMIEIEGIITKDLDIIMGETNEVFCPIISDDDNALQRIIKRALALKLIDIKNYAGRFKDAGDMSNHKRALLHHGKMSLEKFMKWLNVLDLEYEIVIRDKHGAPNPMNEELRDC
jgi:hypothetical protein